MSQYHTIPRRILAGSATSAHHEPEARHFAGGKTDKAVSCGDASQLYELNVWAMTCGRAKERIVSVQDELATKKRYVSNPDPSYPDPSASPPTLLGLTHTRAGDLIVIGRMPHGRGGGLLTAEAAAAGALPKALSDRSGAVGRAAWPQTVGVSRVTVSHALSCLLSA